MSYSKLSTEYYKISSEELQQEISKRKNGYGSYLTGLDIRGFRKGKVTSDTFELFYVNCQDLMMLNNQVLNNSAKIMRLVNYLPNYVVQPYFNKLLINEAQSNNEIEGVKSTKKEISDALKEVTKSENFRSEPKNKKFIGMMKIYKHIDEINPFDTLQSFRMLYDDLVADEVNPDDAPDGKLFRNAYVEVSGGNGPTHIGVPNEASINLHLQKLIDFLGTEEHPPLYKFMIAHYYYEYIHPFYDGNGRTGRLLIGSYLSRYLERYSAITFSYAVNHNKSKYYKSLEGVPHPLNYGEVTHYLIDMLELLAVGQQGVIDDLEENLTKLKHLEKWLKSYVKDDAQLSSKLLITMLGVSIFIEDNRTFPQKELEEVTGKSYHVVKNAMEKLIEEGYIEVVKKSPKEYIVKEEFLNELFPA